MRIADVVFLGEFLSMLALSCLIRIMPTCNTDLVLFVFIWVAGQHVFSYVLYCFILILFMSCPFFGDHLYS